MTGLEVRWFLAGDLPTTVDTWFGQTTGAVEPGQSRTDVYLLVPDRPGLGLKLREGRLELKWRGDAFPLAVRRSAGHAEWWSKTVWPYTDGDRVEAGFAELPPSSRVAVEKRRRQKALTLHDDNRVSPDGVAERGALVEVTALSAAGWTGWTLGVDVLAQPSEAPAVLARVLDWWLANYPGPNLTSALSMGYPEWLLSRVAAA